MKKFKLYFLFLTLALISSWSLSAQSKKQSKSEVPLKPLFELFTSSTCAPCANANPVFDALLENNPGTHSVIKYQVNFPGTGDPYYTPEVGVRTNYYSVSGVPHLKLNSHGMHPMECTQNVYDSYQGLTTNISIDVINANIDLSNILNLNININSLDSYAAGLKAHVVVVEQTTVGNIGNNGELEFHYVMMKMLPDASGTTLPAMNNGDTENLSFSFDMSSTHMETANDLEVIVFIQDENDKSIIQSEQAEIDSELLDYNVNINVLDEDSNPVLGAELFLEGYGTKFSNEEGHMTYEGVLPGTYNYSIIAAGLISTEGTIEVIDNDVDHEIVMANPGYYYYEDFTEGIPEDYTIHVTSPDYLYTADGKVIFFRQSGTDVPIMLVSKLIDITPGEKIFFDIGEGFPAPGEELEIIFGLVTDPNNPETFSAIETLVATEDWITHEYLLEDISNGAEELYFAWKLNTTEMSFCSMDHVKINYGQTGEEHYNVSFQIFDGGDPVADAEVTIDGITQTTSSNGDVTFEDLPNGNYTYTIEAYGYLYYEDELTINGDDVFEQVNLLIDRLFDMNDKKLKVYPNPVSSILHIQTEDEIKNLTILNSNGQISYDKNVQSNNLNLSLNHLQKGVYILKITTKEEAIFKKIIID